MAQALLPATDAASLLDSIGRTFYPIQILIQIVRRTDQRQMS